MFIARNIAAPLRMLAEHFPVVALTGGRQTGKTTLMRQTFAGLNYVSLDLPSLADKAEHSPAAFLEEFPPPLIIDEVQYAPGLFRHLKQVVEADRHAMGRFFLSGSQKFQLMREMGDSLAGRIGILELETLTMAEIMGARPGTPLERIICRGQFPELWRQPDMPTDSFYSSYLATYLERDVRQLMNVTSLRDFERFIRVLAARSGQLLNKSEVARDLGVSVKTVGEWLGVLVASNQIFLLEPYFRNISKRIIKSPKLYFADTGLLCFLLKVTERSLADSPFLGAIWETFVFAELRKQNQLSGEPCNIFYYRDQRAREVDFFLERGGVVNLVECKWTERAGRREAAAITQLGREINQSSLPLKNRENFIICNPAHSYPVDESTTALNLEQFLARL